MSDRDKAAQERIDVLESQLDAADFETEELQQTIKDRDQVIKSLLMERDQMLCR